MSGELNHQLGHNLAALIGSTTRFAEAQAALALGALDLVEGSDSRERLLNARRKLLAIQALVEQLQLAWTDRQQGNFSQILLPSTQRTRP